ncbi:DNA-directed RNA polymerase II subunit RPB1 [Pseudohyphozyma bogoriensis]|nr:DNA-directed RNA polymerase II subunit RPB1 [Pseudohyphozyma bogoriensis]
MGNSKDVEAADEHTALLSGAGQSGIAPPPYSIEAEQPAAASSSSRTPSSSRDRVVYAATVPPASSSSLYPSLPASSPAQPAPQHKLNPTAPAFSPCTLPHAPPPRSTSASHPSGPTPLRTLPTPVLFCQSHREADRRARWRVFWALVWGFLIWVLVVNIVSAPELEPVRRESEKKVRRVARKVWRWVKGGWRQVTEWEKEHHVVEKVGDGFNKVVHPGQRGEPTFRANAAITTPPLASAAGVADLD